MRETIIYSQTLASWSFLGLSISPVVGDNYFIHCNAAFCRFVELSIIIAKSLIYLKSIYDFVNNCIYI